MMTGIHEISSFFDDIRAEYQGFRFDDTDTKIKRWVCSFSGCSAKVFTDAADRWFRENDKPPTLKQFKAFTGKLGDRSSYDEKKAEEQRQVAIENVRAMRDAGFVSCWRRNGNEWTRSHWIPRKEGVWHQGRWLERTEYCSEVFGGRQYSDMLRDATGIKTTDFMSGKTSVPPQIMRDSLNMIFEMAQREFNSNQAQ